MCCRTSSTAGTHELPRRGSSHGGAVVSILSSHFGRLPGPLLAFSPAALPARSASTCPFHRPPLLHDSTSLPAESGIACGDVAQCRKRQRQSGDEQRGLGAGQPHDRLNKRGGDAGGASRANIKQLANLQLSQPGQALAHCMDIVHRQVQLGAVSNGQACQLGRTRQLRQRSKLCSLKQQLF